MVPIRSRVGVRGTRWECRARNKGGVPFSRTFGDRRSALKWSRFAETALGQGEILVDSDDAERIETLRHLLVRYRKEVWALKKGGKKEASRINSLLCTTLADMRIESLSAAHIAKYRISRLREIGSA